MADTKDLLVRFRGDSSGLDKTLKSVDSNVKKNHVSFLKMSTAVAAGTAAFHLTKRALTGVIGVVGDSVKQYEEAETAQKQLRHAVIDVTGATEKQLKATNELADSLAKKGVLDDDVIRAGQAQLSTFGLTNKSVQKLSKAMADLTVNQSGVNATTDDAISSANIMAKALNGNYGALEKMGIHLTQTQRDLIKYGDETKKVNTINEVLAANLRTNQATALQTTEGKIAHLNVILGNLKETFGGVIIQALTPFIAKLTEFVNSDQFQAWVEKATLWLQVNLPKAINYIVTQLIPQLVNIFKSLIPVIKSVLSWLGDLIKFMSDHRGAVLLLASAFVALKVAMGIAKVVSAFKSGMVVLRASYAVTQALLSTPILITVAVAAAIAAMALIRREAQKTMDTLDLMDRAIASSRSSQADAHDGLLRLYQHGTPAQKARAKKALDAGLASGGDAEQGRRYTVGERGIESFTPNQSGYVTPHGKSAGGGDIHLHLHVGMYAGMAIEKRQIAVEFYKELVRVARAHNIQLPMIGIGQIQ